MWNGYNGNYQFTEKGVQYVGRFRQRLESVHGDTYVLVFGDGSKTTILVSDPTLAETTDNVSARGPQA
ncbi:hypothetical protein QCA50_005277 [Cerrena zonata]|uniref:Uncharacterized protein n=1 Tax=Cerrena zonata TaxID=2478898 RepID=A0AAW0GEE3_9APHY